MNMNMYIHLFKSSIALEFFFMVFIGFMPVYFIISLASGNSIFLKYRQNGYYSYLLFIHVNYSGFL